MICPDCGVAMLTERPHRHFKVPTTDRDRLAEDLHDELPINGDADVLADRLIALGWTRECEHCDPRHEWPCPTIPRCDEPGCESEATCGWPTRPGGTLPNGGYRRTCGDHMRAAKAYREDTDG